MLHSIWKWWQEIVISSRVCWSLPVRLALGDEDDQHRPWLLCKLKATQDSKTLISKTKTKPKQHEKLTGLPSVDLFKASAGALSSSESLTESPGHTVPQVKERPCCVLVKPVTLPLWTRRWNTTGPLEGSVARSLWKLVPKGMWNYQKNPSFSSLWKLRMT